MQKTIGHEARKAEDHLDTLSHITAYQDDVSRVVHSNFFRRLQGKSQLFPAGESDFFRNRLTHSLEVASIGKAIAQKFNDTHQLGIPLEVVELAGLCHDTGHPPFGHQGEKALFELMKQDGGFEGNAQTIRLVSRIEKLVHQAPQTIFGVTDKQDTRCGLNLTARSLASLLKYDRAIPLVNEKFCKGYYESEKETVDWMKQCITGQANYQGTFKTIECSIMDVADDTAYSTFDLVDALHAGFIRISDLMTGGSGISTMLRVAEQVTETLRSEGLLVADQSVSGEDVLGIITGLLIPFFSREKVPTKFDVDFSASGKYTSLRKFLRDTERLASNGYRRTRLARYLIKHFVDGVVIDKENKEITALSTVRFNPDTLREIECLKKFIYVTIISKSRVQITEYRAHHVINTIFHALTESKNIEGMLPDDAAYIFRKLGGDDPKSGIANSNQKRAACDFIAGMTDRYALEFYGRLSSQDPETIFKPI